MMRALNTPELLKLILEDCDSNHMFVNRLWFHTAIKYRWRTLAHVGPWLDTLAKISAERRQLYADCVVELTFWDDKCVSSEVHPSRRGLRRKELDQTLETLRDTRFPRLRILTAVFSVENCWMEEDLFPFLNGITTFTYGTRLMSFEVFDRLKVCPLHTIEIALEGQLDSGFDPDVRAAIRSLSELVAMENLKTMKLYGSVFCEPPLLHAIARSRNLKVLDVKNFEDRLKVDGLRLHNIEDLTINLHVDQICTVLNGLPRIRQLYLHSAGILEPKHIDAICGLSTMEMLTLVHNGSHVLEDSDWQKLESLPLRRLLLPLLKDQGPLRYENGRWLPGKD